MEGAAKRSHRVRALASLLTDLVGRCPPGGPPPAQPWFGDFRNVCEAALTALYDFPDVSTPLALLEDLCNYTHSKCSVPLKKLQLLASAVINKAPSTTTHGTARSTATSSAAAGRPAGPEKKAAPLPQRGDDESCPPKKRPRVDGAQSYDGGSSSGPRPSHSSNAPRVIAESPEDMVSHRPWTIPAPSTGGAVLDPVTVERAPKGDTETRPLTRVSPPDIMDICFADDAVQALEHWKVRNAGDCRCFDPCILLAPPKSVNSSSEADSQARLASAIFLHDSGASQTITSVPKRWMTAIIHCGVYRADEQ